MPNLKKEDLIYAAAFVDGEGCIFLSRRKSKDGKEESPRAYVAVANTYKPIIEWFKTCFGGYIITRKAFGNNKESYQWRISGIGCLDCLRLIYPYLKIKRLQAEIIFKFNETIFPSAFGQGRKVPEDILQKRLDYKTQIQLLNKKGYRKNEVLNRIKAIDVGKTEIRQEKL